MTNWIHAESALLSPSSIDVRLNFLWIGVRTAEMNIPYCLVVLQSIGPPKMYVETEFALSI